jgi:hypothetical protein
MQKEHHALSYGRVEFVLQRRKCQQTDALRWFTDALEGRLRLRILVAPVSESSISVSVALRSLTPRVYGVSCEPSSPERVVTGPIFWTKWSERLHMAFGIKKVEFCWDWKVSGAGGR